jgi:exonuclease III
MRTNPSSSSNKKRLIEDMIGAYDICAVQETHLDHSPRRARLVSNIERSINHFGQILWHHYNSQQRGVAIYFSNEIVPYLTETKLSDNEGRLLMVQTTLFRNKDNGTDKSHTWIGALYAPNQTSDRKTFFRDTLSTILHQIPTTDRVILAGDFNSIVTSLDKHGGNPMNGYEGASELLCAIGTHLLCDAWREFHPNKIGWTHSSTPTHGVDSQTAIRTRIDRIYATGPFLYDKHIQTKNIYTHIKTYRKQKTYKHI